MQLKTSEMNIEQIQTFETFRLYKTLKQFKPSDLFETIESWDKVWMFERKNLNGGIFWKFEMFGLHENFGTFK